MRLCGILLAVSIWFGASCAHTRYIEGTSIRSTPQKLEIFNQIVKIRTFLENRDAKGLLGLVSTRYFEDNGTLDPHDDYGYVELEERLMQDGIAAVKELYLTFELHDLVIEDNNHAYADVRYTSRTRLELPSGRLWDTHSDFDRLKFIREEGVWKIVSGL